MTERHVEIHSSNYTYLGKMTMKELLDVGEKYNINAMDVIIEDLIMLGWGEVDMLWEATANTVPQINFKS